MMRTPLMLLLALLLLGGMPLTYADFVYSGTWNYMSPVDNEPSSPPAAGQDVTAVGFGGDDTNWYFRIELEADTAGGDNYIYGIYVNSRSGGADAGLTDEDGGWGVPADATVAGVDYIFDSHTASSTRWGNSERHGYSSDVTGLGDPGFTVEQMSGGNTNQGYNSNISGNTVEWLIPKSWIQADGDVTADSFTFWAATLDGTNGSLSTRDVEGTFDSTVPEPGSMLLALLGCCAGYLVRRRRTQRG